MANLEQWKWKGVGPGQHLSCKMDSDQEEFFQWKAKLEMEFRKQPEKAPVFELARSLGLRLDISELPEDSEEKKTPASNQRIKEINKQRELDEAQKELVKMRTKLEEKLVLIGERWRKVERGQKLLKQNLVKYNNFVREKRGKVADEISRRMSEKQRQQERKKTSLRSHINIPVSRSYSMQLVKG